MFSLSTRSNNFMALSESSFLFIISSPSGAGKSTICKKLLNIDKRLILSVSVTTREIRAGEKDGEDYFFLTKEKFHDLEINGKLLEYAKVFDNFYGTPLDFVLSSLSEGKDVLFDIDWQGVRQLKTNKQLDVVTVFILPPSIIELERRLRERGNDKEETIQKRMSEAILEISHYNEYDYVLINDDLEKTIEQIQHILSSERIKRQQDIKDFAYRLINGQ